MSYKDDAIIKIWLGNYEAYNSGILVGEWFSLPNDSEIIDDVLRKLKEEVLECGEEWGIFDYECDFFRIPEYSYYGDVVKFAEAVEDCIYPLEAIELYLDQQGDVSLLEATELIEEKIEEECFIFANNLYELGKNYINELYGGVDCLSKDVIESYFNFEDYASDLLADEGDGVYML